VRRDRQGKSKSSSDFSCIHCGYAAAVDLVAARNIRDGRGRRHPALSFSALFVGEGKAVGFGRRLGYAIGLTA
jgi:transposase